MFISCCVCVTGSFFHHDGQNTSRKLSGKVYRLAAAFTVESITAIAVMMVGLFALSLIAPRALSTLPLSVKVTMISGGSILFTVNVGYSYYRIKKLKMEVRKELQQARKELLATADEIEKELSKTEIVSESTSYLQHENERLELGLAALKKSLKNLQDVSHANGQTPSVSCQALLDETSRSVREMEFSLAEAQNLVDRVQTKSTESTAQKKEMLSDINDRLAQTNAMLRKLS